ncbi:MAG: hypothetical protein ACYS7Y_24490 [Planctomycetota bacterium]
MKQPPATEFTGAKMVIKSPGVISSLADFLARQISERRIQYLIPLESKGALLMDLAMQEFPSDLVRPDVLYLRSLEYLPPEIRDTASFGILDDFVFSGHTIGRAIDLMSKLKIPRRHIHPMAFFKFRHIGSNEDARRDMLSETVVPSDGGLLQLSQDEILKDVQELAIEHKIPASYDNLDWDISVGEHDYARLMRYLAKTGWYLYYGQRGKLDASALLVRTGSGTSFSALPKIRFWYDSSKRLLHTSPISFAKAGKSRFARRCATLKEVLTPEQPTRRQRIFAAYQSAAICEQVALLGYLKPYLRKFRLTPKLNNIHLERYFGPRATEVVQYLEECYRSTPELSIPAPTVLRERRLDFYWIAVEIMRALSKAYWTQSPPRKESRGFSVSELIDKFSGIASLEAVHAAIDYCADMNLIATFFGWRGAVPFRAFRLTENGETEVGRYDGTNSRRLTFIEKFGALILSKSKNQEAYWWRLEKVPAILMRRLRLPLPQLEAAMDYFGDMTRLRPTDTIEDFLTWPEFGSPMWQKYEEKDTKAKIFKLSSSHFEKYKDDILNDQEIIRAIGPTETVLELTKSKTMGHHVAILLDILYDRASGCTYLANSLRKVVCLIELRHHLSDAVKRQEASEKIGKWLKGLDEKARLLTDRRQKLFDHMNVTVSRLTRQGRGEVAVRLVEDLPPFPQGNRIIPAFKDLSSIVKKLNRAMKQSDSHELARIARAIVPHNKYVQAPYDEEETAFLRIAQAIRMWAAALSGELQDDEVYQEARLDVKKGEVYRMYIVAYDLIGSSGKRYAGREGADRDRHIQSIISNWFVAFGGYAQRTEFGGGDLGFGFFHSAATAIQASLWASYHLELLKGTNPLLRQKKPHAGFGIVQDDLHSGFEEQIKSYWLSKFAKAWKREAERIADNAGRQGRPVIAVHDDLFSGVLDFPGEWLGDRNKLDGIPVRFIKSEAISALPWRSK